MLTVYRSNRAEWLANVLSEQLRITPPEPFETVEVIVNTWPTSRWLGEELATVNGISALIRFPFPGTRLKELVKSVLGLEKHSEDHWKASRLVWHILEVLPELLTTDEASPLREWLNQHPSNPGQINREKWQLAKSIANAFDDYALYRTEEISKWLKISNKRSQKITGTNEQKDWQPLLMRLLMKRIESEPFGIQVQRAIAQLKNATSPVKGLPNQLHIFGLSSLAPIQVELIQALSGVINIKIFLLTPCRDLWQRCELRRGQLGKRWNTPLDGDWLFQSPRLEANLGRMGAEFQQLLEGSGESQLGEWQEGDLFAAPANIATKFNKEPSLLEQLQQELVTLNNKNSLKRKADDTSLLFVACPGRWRQVQLVRDQILQWLAHDSSLEPRDILIMTPQVNRYAPLISSVFNDTGTTNVELPFRITDRSQQNCPGLTQYILQFLDLSSSRLNASTLDSLLANQAIQKQQGLSHEDANRISEYLQLTGFRWGLDAKERGGDEVHSLTWCIERWLLGLILPEDKGLAPGGAAPFSKKITFNELKKWWNFLSLFCNQLQEFRYPHTCEQWVDLLTLFANDLFGDGGLWAVELRDFFSALEDWRHIAGNCQLKLEGSVVSDILKKELNLKAGRFGHRTGLLTISELEPMRAIPHRVIVLMGLDSDIYPRHKDHPGYHLLGKKRKLGDPRSSDQDRYVLLEALMSSRQHLMVTWNNRNERTGEVIPPANPIQQWLSQLENELGKDDWEGVLRSPHPNPLAQTNFLKVNNQSPISCDRRHLEARLWLNKTFEKRSLAIALPLQWNNEEGTNGTSNISNEVLKSWLQAPQRIWLEQLKLQPREWINPLEDLEKLDLNELQRHRLLKERFEELLSQLPINIIDSPISQNQKEWEYRCAGQGTLPPKAAASIECELLEKRWESLQTTLNKLGPCKKQLQVFDGNSKEFLWAGKFVVVVELGMLKAKNAMEGWLNHLQACSNGKSPNATIVIARSSSSIKAKQNQFEIALKWKPISSIQAKVELNKLKIIASKGLKDCWPIPPESGWAMAKTKPNEPSKAFKAFQQKWDGSFSKQGERESPEMQLCFGINFESNNFIHSNGFKDAFSSLYKPIIENLIDH